VNRFFAISYFVSIVDDEEVKSGEQASRPSKMSQFQPFLFPIVVVVAVVAADGSTSLPHDSKS
jgi:ABC-type uncharacterized transport system permease subunit